MWSDKLRNQCPEVEYLMRLVDWPSSDKTEVKSGLVMMVMLPAIRLATWICAKCASLLQEEQDRDRWVPCSGPRPRRGGRDCQWSDEKTIPRLEENCQPDCSAHFYAACGAAHVAHRAGRYSHHGWVLSCGHSLTTCWPDLSDVNGKQPQDFRSLQRQLPSVQF